MNRTTRRTILILATAFVWLAAGAASVGKFKLAAKPPLVISLGTSPANVRIFIDGQPQFEGNYVATPVKVNMAPGKHKLKISREGFIAHLVSVEGDSGEVFKMEDVVLQRNANFNFGSAEITADVQTGVHVEVDDGAERGETPFVANDLVTDQQHVLSVYPKWPEKDARFRCKFVFPNPEDAGEPTVQINLKVKGGRVRSATGCEKIGKKK
jgi:hypothetical protein